MCIHTGADNGAGTKDAVRNILDGLFQASQAAADGLNAKGDQLKERLNNRLDGAKDSIQSALSSVGSAVVSTADIVKDTTKLVAEFLTEDLANTDLKGSLTESGAAIRDTINTLNGLVYKFASILKATTPKIPSWETIKNPKDWPMSLMTYTGEISAAMSSLAEETGKVYEGISARYCKAARVTPSKKVPGKYTGPAFKLKLSSGECYLEHLPFDQSELYKSKLTCKTPYLEWLQKPIKYVSKHHSAISFESKECKMEKTFGAEREEVLFEVMGDFDFSSALQQASDKIQESFESIAGANDRIPDEFKSFVSDISNDKETAETVSKYDQATVDATLSMIDGVISYTNGGGNQLRSYNIPAIGGGSWSVNQVDSLEY